MLDDEIQGLAQFPFSLAYPDQPHHTQGNGDCAAQALVAFQGVLVIGYGPGKVALHGGDRA